MNNMNNKKEAKLLVVGATAAQVLQVAAAEAAAKRACSRPSSVTGRCAMPVSAGPIPSNLKKSSARTFSKEMTADLPESCDVLVVGAGPAGSCAAWASALGGAGTCLIEDRQRHDGQCTTHDQDLSYSFRHRTTPMLTRFNYVIRLFQLISSLPNNSLYVKHRSNRGKERGVYLGLVDFLNGWIDRSSF